MSVETFDPQAVTRLTAAVDEAVRTGATFALARTADVQDVLRQLKYAKASRLEVAEGSAALRARGDEAFAERDDARAIARRLWGASVGGPDDPLGQWVCPNGAPPWLTASTPEEAAAVDAGAVPVVDVDAALERAQHLAEPDTVDGAEVGDVR